MRKAVRETEGGAGKYEIRKRKNNWVTYPPLMAKPTRPKKERSGGEEEITEWKRKLAVHKRGLTNASGSRGWRGAKRKEARVSGAKDG